MATKFETRKAYPGVRRREGSKTWDWRVRINGQDYSDFGFNSAKAAFEAKEQFRVELKSKGVSNINCNKTVEHVYTDFIEEQGLARAVSTITKYKSLWKHHIAPVFANRQIRSVTTTDLEDFFVKLGQPQKERKRGNIIVYSKGHIDAIRKLMNNIFKRAMKCNYIFTNPLMNMSKDLYKSLGEEAEQGTYLEANEVALISERFKNKNLYTAFMLGYHTGMRISEVFGLLDTDIDFHNRVIRVRRQLLYIKPLWVFAPLKTPAAYRDIEMTDQLYYYLKIYMAQKEAIKKELGDRYISTYNIGILRPDHSVEIVNKSVPVLNVKENGKLLTSGSATYMCKVVRAELGLSNFSFHDLRHTHLTDLANSGFPPLELKIRAGHEKITTTLSTYYHSNKRSKDLASTVLKSIEVKDYNEAKEYIETQKHLAAEWLEDEHASMPTSEDILGGEFTSTGGFTPLNRLKSKNRTNKALPII